MMFSDIKTLNVRTTNLLTIRLKLIGKKHLCKNKKIRHAVT